MHGENEIYSKYASEIAGYARIDHAREAKLSQTVRHSKSTKKITAAVNELVLANLRLVLHCLKDFMQYLDSPEISLTQMDLISEGNIALVAAARRFNACFSKGNKTAGTRFSTYACKCIRSRMLRALKLARLIHIPERHFAERKKLDQVCRKHDRALTDSELAGLTGMTKTRLNMIKHGRNCRISKIQDLATEDGTAYSIENLPDRTNPAPDRLAENRDLMDYVYAQFKHLKPRTRDMISELYLSADKTTLHDLSRKFGVSKERCRQICSAGLHKLRELLRANWDQAVFNSTGILASDSFRTAASPDTRGLALPLDVENAVSEALLPNVA